MARTDRQLDPQNPTESEERRRARQRGAEKEETPARPATDDADGDAPV